MDVHRDLEELKQRLDALQSDQETSEALSQMRRTIKSLEDKIALSERFAKIEQEHKSWKTLAKYLAITVALIGPLLAIVGIKSLNDFLKGQVEDRFAYAQELGYGMALADKHPTFAIPHLIRCFKEKPLEEPLVLTLLSVADTADDLNTQRSVMEELRKHGFPPCQHP